MTQNDLQQIARPVVMVNKIRDAMCGLVVARLLFGKFSPHNTFLCNAARPTNVERRAARSCVTKLGFSKRINGFYTE